MKKMMLNGLSALMIMGITGNSFAVELSLSELRAKVLGDNLDIQIQYENYYQSQKNVGVALGDLLPRLSSNYFFFNSTFGILQSIVPTPSSWFKYEASKDLATAEKYTTTSIKLNILKGLTQNYIEVKKNEKSLASLIKQEEILVKVYDNAVIREELGIGTENETFMAERKLRQLRQDIFFLNSVIVSEKEGLLIAINENPSESLELADLPVISMNIPSTIEEAQNHALDNSTELVSNFYLAQAAKHMVSSAKWSFISFDGIGFGYPSSLSIEKSRSRVISLKKEKIENEIDNQVYTSYKELDIVDLRLDNQKMIVNLVEKILQRQTDLLRGGVITFAKFADAQINVLAEKRKLVDLTMQKRFLLASIRRLLNMDASLTQIDMTTYENSKLAVKVIKSSKRRTIYSFALDLDELDLTNVYAVNYSVEGMFNGEALEISNADTKFTYTLKIRNAGQYTVNAEVLLMNGKKITKQVTVKL